MASEFTDITILLDCSGSMESIKEATVKAINGFIEDQKKVAGEGCWTLVQFDDPGSAAGARERFPHVLFSQKSEKEVPLFELPNFQPRGGTALIDALCLTIQQTKDRILALPAVYRPKVLFVIMTDGEENSSREFTTERLRELIAETQTQYGFGYLYLGANQDAFKVASHYGIQGGLSYQANAVGTAAVMTSGAICARAWKADGNESLAKFVSDANQEPSPGVKVTVEVGKEKQA